MALLRHSLHLNRTFQKDLDTKRVDFFFLARSMLDNGLNPLVYRPFDLKVMKRYRAKVQVINLLEYVMQQTSFKNSVKTLCRRIRRNRGF